MLARVRAQIDRRRPRARTARAPRCSTPAASPARVKTDRLCDASDEWSSRRTPGTARIASAIAGDDLGPASFADVRNAFDQHEDRPILRARCTSADRDAIIAAVPTPSCPIRSAPTAHAHATPRRHRIATRRSSSCCSSASTTTSPGSYELAINVWTRALFLDRSHARARAYIERARSALAERQRESEELLQNGVAAFQRGEGDEARRLLQAAIDGGAPSEEALAVLERLNRLEATAAAGRVAAIGARRRANDDRARQRPSRASVAGIGVVAIAVLAVVDGGPERRAASGRSGRLALVRAARRRRGARRTGAVAGAGRSRGRAAAAAARRDGAAARPSACRRRPPARRAGRCSTRSGRPIRSSADADRLRGDIQRQLLALSPVPSGDAPAREKGARRNP